VRAEYDFFIEPDEHKRFKNAKAVNEALRSLIREAYTGRSNKAFYTDARSSGALR
jgi:hypothetical protein